MESLGRRRQSSPPRMWGLRLSLLSVLPSANSSPYPSASSHSSAAAAAAAAILAAGGPVVVPVESNAAPAAPLPPTPPPPSTTPTPTAAHTSTPAGNTPSPNANAHTQANASSSDSVPEGRLNLGRAEDEEVWLFRYGYQPPGESAWTKAKRDITNYPIIPIGTDPPINAPGDPARTPRDNLTGGVLRSTHV